MWTPYYQGIPKLAENVFEDFPEDQGLGQTTPWQG